MQQIILFLDANNKLVSFIKEFVWAKVNKGFEKGLPSTNMLKGQTEQHMHVFRESSPIVVNCWEVLLQRCSLFNELLLYRVGPSSLGVVVRV